MTKLTSILVATDLSARSDRAVRRAVQIARDQNAKLRVMTVLDDAMPEDVLATLHAKTLAALQRFVSTLSNGVDIQVDAQAGDPTTEILNACEAHVDLLVMGTHRTRPFMDSLRETTAQRITRLTATPVLLVTDRADHPYAKVLCACDFSPASGAAVKMAHAIAPTATLAPVHALHVPYAGRLAQNPAAQTAIEASFRNEAESDAKAWLSDASLPTGRMTDLEILPGSALAVLHNKINTDTIDLVAVGAHGRVGAARSLLGSLATDLMRDPPCDVLIARP